LNIGIFAHNLPFLLRGVEVTVSLAPIVLGVSVVLGLLLAFARLSPIRPLAWAAALVINIFRSIPILVLLVWILFVLPILTGLALPAFASAVIGLGLAYGVIFAEVFRAGILSVPAGQREAALAQGMTGAQVMRRVVLPQAVVLVLPPTISNFVSLLKDTSIASLISVTELMYQANVLASATLQPLAVLTGAAVFYFVMTYPLTLLGNAVHRRLSQRLT
jgi:His/Glu/Gln/Arg/opine family amino acid ABC transporter permease subunit